VVWFHRPFGAPGHKNFRFRGIKIGDERSAENIGTFVRETAETEKAAHRGHEGHRGGFKIDGKRHAVNDGDLPFIRLACLIFRPFF
jgi:hypothetical protein